MIWHHDDHIIREATSESTEQDIGQVDQAEDGSEQVSEFRKTRSLVFHLIYAMEMYDYEVTLETLIENLNWGFEQEIDPNGESAQEALAIIAARAALDEYIVPFLANWRLERIGICTRLILRMSVWELLNSGLPPKSVINEAIELAKCFSERDAYKFVNGVLDEILKRLDNRGNEQTEPQS